MADREPPSRAPDAAPGDLAARLRDGAAQLGVALDSATTARLLTFAGELLRWNSRVDLIGPADLPTIVDRHLLDALAPLPLLRAAGIPGAGTGRPVLADVGSGAGLPGLPIGMAEPGLDVVSIEPRARRAAFQRHVIRRLGLGNVRVLAVRLPTRGPLPPIAGAPVDAVVARAVGSIPAFLDFAGRLVRPGGVAVAMRGPRGPEEAAAAAPAAERLGFRLEERRDYRLPGEGGGRTRVLLLYRLGGGAGRTG